MFNTRPWSVDGVEHWPLYYEAPLLRRPADRDRDKGWCEARCDLILVDLRAKQERLIAVEVKCQGNASTNLDYGLLEASVYGALLAKLSQRDGFLKQIAAAWKRLRGEDINEKISWRFAFAVAGPRYYFDAQRETFGDGYEKLQPFEDAAKTAADGASFAGFWVLDGDGHTVKDLVESVKDVASGCRMPGKHANKLKSPSLAIYGSCEELAGWLKPQ